MLRNEDLTETVREFLDAEVEAMADTFAAGLSPSEWNLEGFSAALKAMGVDGTETSEEALDEAAHSRETLIGHVRDLVDAQLEARNAEHGEEVWAQVERFVLLRTIDSLWVEHLTEIDDMRRGIGLRGYAQQDPLNEFRREAYRLYEELGDLIRRQVATTIFRVTVKREPATVPLAGPGQPARPEAADAAAVAAAVASAGGVAAPHQHQHQPLADGAAALRRPGSASLPRPEAVRGLPEDPMKGAREAPGAGAGAAAGPARAGFTPSGARIGRNDPCWCGSGQKYKKCHGA